MLIKPISFDRWLVAQSEERELHNKTLEEGVHHYQIAYGHNFRYLDIDPDKKQIGVCEIGCADFPALRYVNKGPACVIVEPMPSEYLKSFCNENNVLLITNLFEAMPDNLNPPNNASEIWMFNVLQHVQDPELFIQKAKRAKTIRYFEPIDTAITNYHPHSFTKHDFDWWFPEVNKYYNETTNQCFHDGPCCYGVWENPNI